MLAHLDPAVLAADPKPFLGYSDNTNLHLLLWRLGLVSYHGGAVMVQLGRPGAVHPATRLSLERALLGHGTYELEPPAESGDVEGDWGDPATLAEEPPLEAVEPWSWHGPATRADGTGVGREPRDRRFPPPDRALSRHRRGVRRRGAVPRDLRGAPRRELCHARPHVHGRSAVCCSASPRSCGGGRRRGRTRVRTRRRTRRSTWRRSRRPCSRPRRSIDPSVPLVFGVDLGHTDPQYVVPSGGAITVDGARRRIEVTY